MFFKKPSDAQLAANRANAQKSSGPKTPEGKAIVSQNRLRHGLCGDFNVLDFEIQARYDELLAQFVRDEKPVGSVEHELVVKMARHTWLSHRANRFQDACFLIEPQTRDQKVSGDNGVAVRHDLDCYLRYQVQHDRAYQRASQELMQRRKERLKAEIGFEREKRDQAAEERREANENRKVERHKVAVAIDQKKFERQELIVLSAQAGLTKQLDAFLPPEKGEIAA